MIVVINGVEAAEQVPQRVLDAVVAAIERSGINADVHHLDFGL
jgi:hypothetical protein